MGRGRASLRAGETWWLEDAETIEAAREEQAEHTETVEDHPWYKLIEQWIRDEEKLVYAVGTEKRLRTTDNSFVFTMNEVLERIGIPSDRWSEQRTRRANRKDPAAHGLEVGWLCDSSATRTTSVWRWQQESLDLQQAAAMASNRARDAASRSIQQEHLCPVHGADIGVGAL